jgi:hypothetical protein
MKRFVAAVFLSFTFATAAHAGAANADISCRSADGKLAFAGNIPGDLGEFDATVQASGRSARLYSVLNQQTMETEENAKLDVVQNLEIRVWTLKSWRTGNGEYGYLEMYAVPKTVSFNRIPNGYRSSFKAKISVNQPELGGITEEGTVRCELQYQI